MRVQLVFKVLIVFILLGSCNKVQGQYNWSLKKQNGRIKAYTSAVPGTGYHAVKVEAAITGTMSQVIAALLDIEKQKDWVFNVKQTRMLRKISENELVYYTEINVPWPFGNRDLISHLKVQQKSGQEVAIESRAEPDGLPVNKNLVRIKKSQAQWKLIRTADNTVQIEYVNEFEPGGGVPAWLSNLFATKGPYETFSKLQERVNRKEYQAASFGFLRE